MKKIPFLFPKPTLVNLGNKKFNIPPKYFAKKRRYLDRERIEFLAITPQFSNIRQIYTKLPDRYKYHTKIFISTISGSENLQNKLNLYPDRNSQELKSEYGLKKKLLPKRISYYRVKDGIVDTVIDCSIDTTYRMNCQHRFIHNGLIYEFRHEQKELKSWRNLQIRLINKVRSWENFGIHDRYDEQRQSLQSDRHNQRSLTLGS